MKSTDINKLHEKIKKQLLISCSSASLKKNKEFLIRYVDSEDFIHKIDTMIKEKDFSCKTILKACDDIIGLTAEDIYVENWLFYMYQYVLDKSFPKSVSIALKPELEVVCALLINIVRIVLEYEKSLHGKEWLEKNTIVFLSAEEERQLENPAEYRKFKKSFEDEYIYEMMRLAEEVTGHSTISHICGVHYVALSIGRQLKRLGVPIDMGRVSGSSAGHDIGKYGCKESELSRVPYLHYFYTDYWFKKHDIPYIGHTAVNHSTWDLELENLPLESLILIYSDFRVKSVRGVDGKKYMKIFSLSEAFDVIFNKLDNMTEQKKIRYKRVYAKIKDFEDYLIHIGVDTRIEADSAKKFKTETAANHYSLMQGQQIVQSFKFLAIKHSIELMHKLRHEHALNSILESARSEDNWKNLREYIRLFDEYSTYLTQKQKLIMLKFLYEQLTHPEDDIRKHCAELIGSLIATFDEDYRKEVPVDVNLPAAEISSRKLLGKIFNSFIRPDSRIPHQHQQWISYSSSIMIGKLFSISDTNRAEDFAAALVGFYQHEELYSEDAAINMLECAKHIPVVNTDVFEVIFAYAARILKQPSIILHLASLDLLHTMAKQLSDDNEKKAQILTLCKDLKYKTTLERYLLFKVSKLSDKSEVFLFKEDEITSIYLKNLKTDTHWLTKKLQIEILYESIIENDIKDKFHTAMHFCNLLKVSGTEKIRNSAGNALLSLVPYLPPDQRNDIAIELIRALEMDKYQFTSYIPYYLGRMMLFLTQMELEEFIDDMVEKIKHSSPQLITLILKTIGIFIANYINANDVKHDMSDYRLEVTKRILQLILNSLADFNTHIKQAAFAALGKEIFDSRNLSITQKHVVFKLTAKKVLTLIADMKEHELQFLSNSATYNQIYRFISEYTLGFGSIELSLPDKIAYFSGTFNPFTLSHKEIARTIRDKGFEVYLAVDEFSWQRQAMPNLIRRSVINMSIADELGIYLYPEGFQINPANCYDLMQLRKNLSPAEVYIVAGSDSLIKSNCYKGLKQENSIHSFPHIIFERKGYAEEAGDREQFKEITKSLERDIIRLELPIKYEDISSSQIRNYLDEKRDISGYIDPLAERYIYEHGVYQREPQFKTLVKSISIEVEVVKDYNYELVKRLAKEFNLSFQKASKLIMKVFEKPKARLIILKDVKNNNEIIGFSAFHWVKSSMIYNEFKNESICHYIYDNAVGSMVLIDGIFIKSNTSYTKLTQMVLAETLSYCLARDYEYAVYYNTIEQKQNIELQELLQCFGFIRLPESDMRNPVFAVNMNNPCTLYMDIRTIIKEPYRSSVNMQQVINRNRKRLMQALTRLYPGNLLIAFDRGMLYETIIKKICQENEVTTDKNADTFGESICVPYGNILQKNIVPNTVTKSLHNEKYFQPDMKGYDIGASPYYLDMDTQLKMIRSFGMPVILVDDLLNKGYRLKALEPFLRKHKLNVKKIIVGILSNRGKELAEIMGKKVDCAYYVPKLRAWFNESAMYPFVGGDALWRGTYPHRNLLPSVNLILPYTYPSFIKGASKKDIFNLSKVAIENALDILTELEEEYQERNERTLTLAALGDVFTIPRCPDHGRDMDYNLNLSPSHYLKNDLEQLKRIEQYGIP